MEVSVIPLESELVARTHIVERNRSLAFFVKNAALAPLCPKDFNVASPCTASKNSDANAA